TFRPAVSYNIGSSVYAVTVTDVNGDGFLDVVTANNTDNSTASVLLGQGDGTFPTIWNYLVPGYVARSVTVGDVNGDGMPDVITGNYGSHSAAVMLNAADWRAQRGADAGRSHRPDDPRAFAWRGVSTNPDRLAAVVPFRALSGEALPGSQAGITITDGKE